MATVVAKKESNDPVSVGMATTSCSLPGMTRGVGESSSAKRGGRLYLAAVRVEARGSRLRCLAERGKKTTEKSWREGQPRDGDGNIGRAAIERWGLHLYGPCASQTHRHSDEGLRVVGFFFESTSREP